jgi:hypothetical protein
MATTTISASANKAVIEVVARTESNVNCVGNVFGSKRENTTIKRAVKMGNP